MKTEEVTIEGEVVTLVQEIEEISQDFHSYLKYRKEREGLLAGFLEDTSLN